MRRLEGWRAGFVAAWIAAAIAACSEPQCPNGYYKEHKTCYRLKDAGQDDQAADDDEEPDSGSESDSEGSDGDAAILDGGPEPADAAGTDSQSSVSGAPAVCTGKCGEHEVCKADDGSAACACGPGYTACQPSCKDLMSDPLNCGSCGYACAEGLACKQGQCEQRIRELMLDGFVSCALYESPDGNFPVKCWGDARFGLFRDERTEALTPRAVTGVPRVRALAVPGGRYCALLPGEDAIRCWGQCGLECGNPADSPTAGSAFSRDVALPGVVRISGAGSGGGAGRNACALTAAGTVYCWGSKNLIASSDDRYTPGPIFVEDHSVFASLDGGDDHTCATTPDGQVGCWGWSDGDALGIATELVSASAPWLGVFVPKESGERLANVVRVAVGANSCAITREGDLWCWGANDGRGSALRGVLGAGDTARHVGAVRIGLDHVVDVAVGSGTHACAIARGGQVYCWGRNVNVGLGAGAFGDAEGGTIFSSPQAVPGLADAVEIRAGSAHTCARRRSGQVVCWGSNGTGELGDGTKVERLSPTPVIGLYN